jgi:hypothetical protein
MLGFLPGFAFMGDLPPVLCASAAQRAADARVPAGSVATAGTLTAIYPWESPGGWHLIGACPLPLFSPPGRRRRCCCPATGCGCGHRRRRVSLAAATDAGDARRAAAAAAFLLDDEATR